LTEFKQGGETINGEFMFGLLNWLVLLCIHLSSFVLEVYMFRFEMKSKLNQTELFAKFKIIELK